MTNTITPNEAQTLIPKIIAQRELKDTIVVAENGRPLMAIISPDDYAYLKEARRRERVREAVYHEWERKFNSPQWDEAFAVIENFPPEFDDIDEDALMKTLDEAIAAVRHSA